LTFFEIGKAVWLCFSKIKAMMLVNFLLKRNHPDDFVLKPEQPCHIPGEKSSIE
jgi:hypothetical protein